MRTEDVIVGRLWSHCLRTAHCWVLSIHHSRMSHHRGPSHSDAFSSHAAGVCLEGDLRGSHSSEGKAVLSNGLSAYPQCSRPWILFPAPYTKRKINGQGRAQL